MHTSKVVRYLQSKVTISHRQKVKFDEIYGLAYSDSLFSKIPDKP